MFKNEQTNIKKYGFGCTLQVPEIKKKSEETKIKRYGDKNYINMEQMKQTNIDKYGVEFPLQSEEIIKKTQDTLEERYGVRTPFQSEEIKDKAEQTLMDKYGVKNPLELKEIYDKTVKTVIDKYGTDKILSLDWIRNKIEKTFMEKYEVKYPSQLDDFKQKNIETKTGLSYEEYIEQLPEHEKYRSEVLSFTNKESIHLLENYNKRGKYDYHLDHRFSIIEGFRQNIEPEIIGSIINIEMLVWDKNISKNKKCSLTKEELFDRYDNKDKLLEQLTEDYLKREEEIIV